MQLLGRHADLADENLTQAIKTFLDPRHENFNKLEFCGLCLVGYDSKAYPGPTELGDTDALLAAITEQLPSLKQSILRRLQAEELVTFGFHVICVPFPSVEEFRSKLLVQMGLT
jgi:hypothetical protein